MMTGVLRSPQNETLQWKQPATRPMTWNVFYKRMDLKRGASLPTAAPTLVTLTGQKFLDIFLSQAKRKLEYYSGLDLLNDFAPIVLENSSFEDATVHVLREYFKAWAVDAVQREQHITASRASKFRPRTGRYRFFVTVDQEALESVLNTSDRRSLGMAFVRLVNAEWEPKFLDEEELEALGGPLDEFEPLEGCTLEDVGWMNVPFLEVGLNGFVAILDANRWDLFYSRPPKIQSLTG